MPTKSQTYMQSFLTLYPTPDQIHAMSFHAFASFLFQPQVVEACLKALRHISKFANQKGKVQMRVFLAAFLIKHFPSKMMDSAMEVRGEKIKTLASRLADEFELVCRAMSVGDVSLCRAFGVTLMVFMEKFRAWRAEEERLLVARIKMVLGNLLHVKRVMKGQWDGDRCVEKLKALIVRFAGAKELEEFMVAHGD